MEYYYDDDDGFDPYDFGDDEVMPAGNTRALPAPPIATTSSKMSLGHLRVSSQQAGIVVGKQGANIMATQKMNGVKCELIDTNKGQQCPRQRGAHCLHITGPLVNVKSAVARINGMLRDMNKPECGSAEYETLKGADAERAKLAVSKATTSVRQPLKSGSASSSTQPAPVAADSASTLARQRKDDLDRLEWDAMAAIEKKDVAALQAVHTRAQGLTATEFASRVQEQIELLHRPTTRGFGALREDSDSAGSSDEEARDTRAAVEAVERMEAQQAAATEGAVAASKAVAKVVDAPKSKAALKRAKKKGKEKEKKSQQQRQQGGPAAGASGASSSSLPLEGGIFDGLADLGPRFSAAPFIEQIAAESRGEPIPVSPDWPRSDREAALRTYCIASQELLESESLLGPVLISAAIEKGAQRSLEQIIELELIAGPPAAERTAAFMPGFMDRYVAHAISFNQPLTLIPLLKVGAVLSAQVVSALAASSEEALCLVLGQRAWSLAAKGLCTTVTNTVHDLCRCPAATASQSGPCNVKWSQALVDAFETLIKVHARREQPPYCKAALAHFLNGLIDLPDGSLYCDATGPVLLGVFTACARVDAVACLLLMDPERLLLLLERIIFTTGMSPVRIAVQHSAVTVLSHIVSRLPTPFASFHAPLPFMLTLDPVEPKTLHSIAKTLVAARADVDQKAGQKAWDDVLDAERHPVAVCRLLLAHSRRRYCDSFVEQFELATWMATSMRGRYAAEGKFKIRALQEAIGTGFVPLTYVP